MATLPTRLSGTHFVAALWLAGFAACLSPAAAAASPEAPVASTAQAAPAAPAEAAAAPAEKKAEKLICKREASTGALLSAVRTCRKARKPRLDSGS